MSSDNSSDSEKEQRDEFSDSEKEELDTDEYRLNAVNDDLRAEYASFADFEQNIKRCSLVCAFIADIVNGKSPEGILYCKERDMHANLQRVLTAGIFEACPKKGPGPRVKEVFTTIKPDEVITVDDAAACRDVLSRGPVRRISDMRNVKKSRK